MAQQKGTELDKLKRRMIRTVARLLKEKKTEEEVWETLKKESGTNCKLLWERMRSLTMKKLKRLLDANDRLDQVPSVARMTLTDWLLYDLVIVHEKIDVIDRNQPKESQVLNNLFSLVQRFSIEGRSGDDLADAWTAATVSYNSKGHQCSPMLMQRRWYQIKELTRDKLYKFWFNYRGNERLLLNAKRDPPTALQRAIALQYPDIITKPFPDWEERIEKKLVIMPDEFEVKLRKKVPVVQPNESVPDVVIIERKIDTITLGDSESDFSDDENSRGSNATPKNTKNTAQNEGMTQTPIIVDVKTEPQDFDDHFEVTEHSPYQIQHEEPADRFQAEIERLRIEEDRILSDNIDYTELIADSSENHDGECLMPLITNVTGAGEARIEDTTQNDMLMCSKEVEIIGNHSGGTIDTVKSEMMETEQQMDDDVIETVEHNPYETGDIQTETASQRIKSIENSCDNLSQESILIDDDEMTSSKEVVRTKHVYKCGPKSKMISRVKKNVIVEKKVIDESRDKHFPVITSIEDDSDSDVKVGNDVIEIEEESFSHKNKDCALPPVKETVSIKEPVIESHNLDFTDEVFTEMSFADDGIEFVDDGIELNEEEQDELPVTQRKENDDNAKFDLKLLMNPVVYSTKLDEMVAYKGRSLLDTIDEKEVIERIFLESKPISSRSINVEQVVEEVKAEDCNANEDHNNVQIKAESQEVNEVDDDLFYNESSDESDANGIDNSKKVKVTSKLLQKPRVRSYHPIQLCKNPDFNTRLKRLTVGFFSSSRNRAFLKACKPMTIDLSKAFESKLVDGTIYLKPSDEVVKKEVENVVESTVSILPSAVAVQSLMDNETADVDKILQDELRKRLSERNKTINLPHISVVRQINQQLLMAEVAPIMAQGEKCPDYGERGIENEIRIDNGAKRLKLNPDTEITDKFNNCTSGNLAPLSAKNDKGLLSVETPKSSSKPHNSTIETLNVAKLLNTLPDEIDNNKSKVEKALERQKRKQERLKHMNYPSWVTKKYDASLNNCSDSLLTIDTLYKMLNALDPCSVQPLPVKVKQKKVNKSEPVKILPKEKVPDIDEQRETRNTNDHIDNDTLKAKRKSRCCWAKTKMDKISGVAPPRSRLFKHKCAEGNCKCCCKELLRQMEIDIEVTILENMQNSSDNFTKVIDDVVQQSRDLANANDVKANSNAIGTNSNKIVKISVDVGLQADMDEHVTSHVINKLDGTEGSTNNLSEMAASITINLDEEETNVSPLSGAQSPKPKIRVYSGVQVYQDTSPPSKNLSRQRQTRIQPVPKVIGGATVQPRPKGSFKSSVSNVPSNTKIRTVPFKYQLYSKDSEDNSKVQCSCGPNVIVDQSSAMLVVDGSKQCIRHTKSRISKETRIYLTRKHMFTTERPFYVGKNKILLTNVKQPKQEPEPIVTLPDGVQIVLLPDRTITYVVDANVQLTPVQIDAMPSILETIQSQVKAAGVTLPVTIQTQTRDSQETGETIDLDDVASESVDTTVSVLNLESNIINLDGAVSEAVDITGDVPNLESNTIESKRNEESNSKHEELSHLTSTASLAVEENQSVSTTTDCVDNQSNLQNELHQETSPNETNTLCEVVTNASEGDGNSQANKSIINKESADTSSTYTEKTTLATADLETEQTSKAVETAENPDIVGNEHSCAEQSPHKNKAVESSETVKSSTAASTSRNLLSDLMEMSGILEEDTALIQEPQEVSVTQSIMQQLTLRTSEMSPQYPNLSVPVPPLSPFTKEKHSISAQINEKLYELNPITSFAELKYACENNGLFFKLDLNNGIIVPINVCIQRNASEIVASKITSHPTEVIDLTDEQGVPIEEHEDVVMSTADTSTTTSVAQHPSRIVPRKLSSLMPSLPDKNSILKTSLLKLPLGLNTVEQKKQALMNRLSNNLKPLKILEKRNQNINILRKSGTTGALSLKRGMSLDTPEARIDLVDSDAPLEEEYLVEDSSEDSDDEPLSKIAKRMRPQHDKGNDQDQERDPPNAPATQDKDVVPNEQNIDFEEAIDAIEPSRPSRVDNSDIIEPVPTQLMMTGGAINEPILLNNAFLPSNEAADEDSQDDCILGV